MKSTKSIKNPKILNIESEIISKIKHGLRNKEIAEFIKGKVGISYRQAKRYAKLYKEYHGKQYNSSTHSIFPQPSQVKDFFGGGFIEGTIEDTADSSIKTLDGLLDACSVDKKVWSVTDYTITKDDKTNKDGTVTPKFRIRAALEKNKEVEFKSLLENFKEEAEKYAPKSFNIKPLNENADSLYVLNVHDLHLGKLCFSPEAKDGDYDIKIAKRVFRDAIDDLMSKAPHKKIKEVVVICGSDFFHVDNDKSSTSHDTYVDSDGRLSKIFQEGVNLLVETVEKISSNFHVTVMCFPGNHDELISMYASHYLAAWFRNNKNVKVENTPEKRKYLGFGNTLLGFTHGSEEKPTDLPMIMFRENMDKVSNYKFFEWNCGHFHHQVVKEMHGVIVRTSPTLGSDDSYHFSKGYVKNNKAAQGLLYSENHGLEAVYYSYP